LCTSLEELKPVVTPESCGAADGAIDLTVVGGAPPLTYMWSTGATTEDLTGLTGGIYDVSVTDGNSCEAFMTIEVPSDTSNIPAIAVSSLTACEGDTIVLTASGASEGYTYEWREIFSGEILTGATDSTLIHTEGVGVYTVSAIGNCPPQQSNMTFMVTIEDAITPLINGIDTDNFIDLFCPIESAILTASDAPTGYTYQWYLDDIPIEGATDMTLTITEEGTYTVEYVSGDESVCLQPSPFLNIASLTNPIFPLISNIGNTLMVTVSNENYDYTYQWYLNGSPIQGANLVTYEATESGIYTVEATYDFYGCTETSPELEFMLVNTDDIIGLNTFEVSPIPVKDVLNIYLATTEKLDLTLQIQNIQGQILLKKEKTITGNWSDTFDMSHLPSGIYFLTIQSENDIIVKKLLR